VLERVGQARASTAIIELDDTTVRSSISIRLPQPPAPRCEIRALVMHVYPDGIKAYPHERLTVYVGRRGKPVRKLRYMPMARAHELARKLQGRFGTTVSVI
jgi:hypothetical protein